MPVRICLKNRQPPYTGVAYARVWEGACKPHSDWWLLRPCNPTLQVHGPPSLLLPAACPWASTVVDAQLWDVEANPQPFLTIPQNATCVTMLPSSAAVSRVNMGTPTTGRTPRGSTAAQAPLRKQKLA